MAYEVLARKWRPAGFSDVVGQEHVTRTLCNAIESNRVAHAYLFIGPRGIGKTSLARIFAKALNCEKGPTPTPCNVCSMCTEISAGNSIDVLEIDGASNNGVEQVRDLREQVQFTPASGNFKIIIIDEVHMLTSAAFNALLKTLEEPPPHVKFIFATTEGDKILPTVISRCQRFDLRRIPVPLIVERLKLICQTEKITVEDDALLAIARGADGGMRDALSSLDQLISFKGDKLDEEDVLAVFGLVSRRALDSLATAILKGEMSVILKLIAEFEESGKDMRRLVVELLEHFRNVLVCQFVGDDLSDTGITPEQAVTLSAQGVLVEPAQIIRITEQLESMEARLRYALSVRTLIEITLIRCARLATTVPLERILRELQELQKRLPATANTEPAKPQQPPQPTPVQSVPATAKTVESNNSPNNPDERLELYNDETLKHVLKEFSGRVLEVDTPD